MANGLFATRNIGTPGEIQRLMQLEQEKRIRDAGAGMHPLVAARARAGQGMQEAISGMGAGLTGLLGGQVRMDPRMQEAVKRDRVRTTMMQKYKDAAADGDVTYEERMAIAADLDAAGFPNEAERARASARAIRDEKRKEELYPTRKSLLEAQASYYASKGTALPQFKSYTKEQVKTLQSALKANKKALAKFKLMFPNDWINMLEGPETENVKQWAEVISRVDQKSQYRLGPMGALNAWVLGGVTSDVSGTPGKNGKGTVYKQKPPVTGQQKTATPIADAASADVGAIPAPIPPVTLGQAMQGEIGPQSRGEDILRSIREANQARTDATPVYPMFAPQPSAIVPAAPVARPRPAAPAAPSPSVSLPPRAGDVSGVGLGDFDTRVPEPGDQQGPPLGEVEMPSAPASAAAPATFTLPEQDRKVFARIESSGRKNAVKGGSIGLYQFEHKTAKDLMPGVTKKQLFDPAIQEELLDRYIKRNAKQLGTTDPYELYMAHQQGVRGYRELLKIRDVRIKDIRDPARKRKVMANRLPLTRADKNATVGDFLDEWKRHYYKLREDL